MKTENLKNRKNALLSVGRMFFMVLAVMAYSTSCTAGNSKPAGDKTEANAQNQEKAIRFTGGTCQISELVLNPMFAPAEMKESEKAFMVKFKFKLNSGVSDEALSALYENGRFVAPDKTSYKAGAATRNDSIYSLVVAVPKDVDVKTLNFIFNKQTIALKQY